MRKILVAARRALAAALALTLAACSPPPPVHTPIATAPSPDAGAPTPPDAAVTPEPIATPAPQPVPVEQATQIAQVQGRDCMGERLLELQDGTCVCTSGPIGCPAAGERPPESWRCDATNAPPPAVVPDEGGGGDKKPSVAERCNLPPLP